MTGPVSSLRANAVSAAIHNKIAKVNYGLPRLDFVKSCNDKDLLNYGLLCLRPAMTRKKFSQNDTEFKLAPLYLNFKTKSLSAVFKFEKNFKF